MLSTSGAAVAISSLAQASTDGIPACGYEVEYFVAPDCGTFDVQSYALGINDAGTVVGYLEGCPVDNQTRAFVWPLGEPAQIIDIPWSKYERAIDINNLGQVALTIESPNRALAVVPALWMAGELVEIFELGPAEWAIVSDVYGINDFGVIVGEYGNSVMGPYPLLCTWASDSGIADLSDPFPVDHQRAAGITSTGLIAGHWFGDTAPPPGKDFHRAFLLDGDAVTELGLAPRSVNSFATAIADTGEVVGYGWGPSGGAGARMGFRWHDGEMTELLPLPLDGHDQVHPTSVNASGVVVGTSNSSGPGVTSRPVIWIANSPVVLTDLVVNLPRGFTTVHGPRAISESGFIAGVGAHLGGYARAFRLVPRLKPVADLDDDCAVGSADLGLLLNNWGEVSSGGAAADLTADGNVDGADLGVLLSEWTEE